MKRIVSSLLCYIVFTAVQGQNLVPNYSFEEYSLLPISLPCQSGPISFGWTGSVQDSYLLSPPWYSPTNGVPFCFRACAENFQYSVPKNEYGFQWPNSGVGYAFLCSRNYCPDCPPNLRQYLQVQLSSELEESKNYYVEFYVSCMDSTNHATSRIGLFFSDTAIWLFDSFGVLPFQPQIENATSCFISNTENWEKISGIYFAHGGEQFITIGNFYNDLNTPDTIINPDIVGRMLAGYYIDDVSVIPLDDTDESNNVVFVANVFSPNGDGRNDILYVRGKNIQKLNLNIFDRWGNKIFYCSDPEIGWNGKHNSNFCEDGVYYYFAEIYFSDGTIISKKGNVTLIK